MHKNYPKILLQIINSFKRFPGVGNKTAERYAFQLLQWSQDELIDLSDYLKTLKEKAKQCPDCGCLTEAERCQFCENADRNQKILCIVASPRDVFSIEQTKLFRGIYQVIEHLISPIDQRSSEKIDLQRLFFQIEKRQVEEVILAFDSTLEGDATALFLKQHLEKYSLKTSRLALGIPMGSSLDFIDENTLARAFMGRQLF